jgi:ADP-ribose pyrophosphatase
MESKMFMPMIPRPWKTLRQETVHRNHWWSYCKDEFETARGVRGEYHFVHTPGSVLVVPVADDGRLVLVSQYRYLGRRPSLEFPGGGIKAGTTAEEAARDELAEEAGVAAARLQKIGEFNPCNGITDEMCAVFLARGLAPAKAAADPTEELVVERLWPDEVLARMQDGTVWDGMTLAAFCLARSHLRPGALGPDDAHGIPA